MLGDGTAVFEEQAMCGTAPFPHIRHSGAGARPSLV